MKHIEYEVLGAILRLSRRRAIADEAEVAERVGGTQSQVRESLRCLRSAGLVQLSPRRGSHTLTMEGLACAVALLPKRAKLVTDETSRQYRAA